jgi:hypothetical protein
MSTSKLLDMIRGSIQQIVTGTDMQEQRPVDSHTVQEVLGAIVILAAAVIRHSPEAREQQELVLHNYIERHLGKNYATKIPDLIQPYIDRGAEPYVKIACAHLLGLCTPASHYAVMGLLLQIAYTAGYVSIARRRQLMRIATQLHLSPAQTDNLWQAVKPMNDLADLALLEETTSLARLKAVYRRLTLQYHPDRRPAYISEQDAHLRFIKLREVYERIQLERYDANKG